MNIHRPRLLLLAATCIVALSASGCASKKFVRTKTAPLETQVGELDTRAKANADSIENLRGDVDRGDSNLGERVDTVANDARKAQETAEGAQESADGAAARAGEAKDFADAGLKRVDKTLADMANYRLVTQESVLFGFDSSVLVDEAKSQLAAVAAATKGKQRFVIEVRGFTDPTGAPEYNLMLSQRRADAVVRALNAEHYIPLRSIHRLGLGEVVAKTREERRLSRKVDVSVFVPLAEAGTQVSSN